MVTPFVSTVPLRPSAGKKWIRSTSETPLLPFAVVRCSARLETSNRNQGKKRNSDKLKVLVTTAALAASLLLPHLARATTVQEHPLRLKSSVVTPEDPSTAMRLKVKWEGIRSLNSRTETYVLFENRSNATIDVNWIDFMGGEELYASMAPGSVHLQPSFATHPWSVRNHVTQDSLDIVVAGVNPKVAVVGEQGINEVEDSKRGQSLLDLFGRVDNKANELVMDDPNVRGN